MLRAMSTMSEISTISTMSTTEPLIEMPELIARSADARVAARPDFVVG
jgi:hypothetical protein